MGIIKNINLNSIEENLKEVIGLSFQARLFQEEYEDVMKQIIVSKKSYSSGNIPKDVYDKNKIMLENERKKLVLKVNETIDKIKKVNDNIQKIIKGNII